MLGNVCYGQFHSSQRLDCVWLHSFYKVSLFAFSFLDSPKCPVCSIWDESTALMLQRRKLNQTLKMTLLIVRLFKSDYCHYWQVLPQATCIVISLEMD